MIRLPVNKFFTDTAQNPERTKKFVSTFYKE